MKRGKPDGRVFVPELVVGARIDDAGFIEILAPAVGLFRQAPAPGTLVDPGAIVGELEVLGVSHRLIAPVEARGVVLARTGAAIARRPVAHGDILARLDPHMSQAAVGGVAAEHEAAVASTGLQFRSPLSGRFYARPAPGKPEFVAVGDIVTRGQTIALLEVMKTFNRLAYGGAGLPERVRVKAVLVRDEDDVQAGTPILELEPI